MGYIRLFELLACLKEPASIKALATCSGMTETNDGTLLRYERKENVTQELKLIGILRGM